MDSTVLMQSVSAIRSKCKQLAMAAAVAGLAAVSSPLFAADDQDAPPVIRPANYDPADELAYTKQRGELSPGMVADGKVWNKAPESRAAVSVAMPAPAEAEGAAAAVSAASGILPYRMTYAEAYAQIPFQRSEYEANPSYRHDAALELMFGQMRPMTVIRQTVPYFSRYPDMFRYRYPVFPYSSSTGGASNFNMNWRTSLIAY